MQQSDIANEKYSKNKHFIQLLPSTYIYSARQKSKHNYINIKTTDIIYLTFLSNFLSFNSRAFIIFVFYIYFLNQEFTFGYHEKKNNSVIKISINYLTNFHRPRHQYAEEEMIKKGKHMELWLPIIIKVYFISTCK